MHRRHRRKVTHFITHGYLFLFCLLHRQNQKTTRGSMCLFFVEDIDSKIYCSKNILSSGKNTIMQSYFCKQRPCDIMQYIMLELPRRSLCNSETLSNFWLGPIIFLFSHYKTHSANGLQHSIISRLQKLVSLFNIGRNNGEFLLQMTIYLQETRFNKKIH